MHGLSDENLYYKGHTCLFAPVLFNMTISVTLKERARDGQVYFNHP